MAAGADTPPVVPPGAASAAAFDSFAALYGGIPGGPGSPFFGPPSPESGLYPGPVTPAPAAPAAPPGAPSAAPAPAPTPAVPPAAPAPAPTPAADPAAALWAELAQRPASEVEALYVRPADPARAQIGDQLLRWSQRLGQVEGAARDQAEQTDLRVRRRRLAAAAVVVGRGVGDWGSVQHTAKIDRWPSAWLSEARAENLIGALDRSAANLLDAPFQVLSSLLPDGWGGGAQSPADKARAALASVRRLPDDLIFNNGRWVARRREAALSLVRTLGGATAVDDQILRAADLGVASDGASQSDATDLGPRALRGDYTYGAAVRDQAREVGASLGKGAADWGLYLGAAGLLLGVLSLLGGRRGD